MQQIVLLLCLLWFVGVLMANANLGSRRQAIPVAVVQGGALAGLAKKEKKNNETLVCNTTYQNCADSLIQQAKFDRKMRKVNTPFNVTESAYNASVAGALDNNKATVLHNKTIHLIHNTTTGDSKKIPNALDNVKITNKTYVKTINVTSPMGNRSTSKGNSLIVDPLSIWKNNFSNNVTNETLFINKTNNSCVTPPSTQISGGIPTDHSFESTGTLPRMSPLNRNMTNDIILTNTTDNIGINVTMPALSKQTMIYNTFYNTTRLTNITNSKLTDMNTTNREETNKRTQLRLPSHAINIYLHWSADRITIPREEEKKKNEDHSHGILVGPLDNLPDNPKGNGPQDTKTKNVTHPNGHKAKLKWRKKRPKRTTYNFDIIGTPRDHTYSYLNTHPDDFAEATRKTMEPVQSNAVTKLYDLSRNPKGMISQPNDILAQNVPPYDLSQEYYQGASDDYDKLLAQEIGNLDRDNIPKVGTSYPNDGIDTAQHIPIGTPSMTGTYQDSTTLGSILNENAELKPQEEEPGASERRSDLTPFLEVIKKANEKNVEGTFPYSTEFSSDNLAARGAIPASNIDEVEHKERDKQIQNLLNTYDLQTKEIADLYSKIIKHMTPPNENNVDARSFTPAQNKVFENRYQEEPYHERFPEPRVDLRPHMPYPEKESMAYPEKMSEIVNHEEDSSLYHPDVQDDRAPYHDEIHDNIPDTGGRAIEGVPYPYPQKLRDPDSNFQRRNNDYQEFHGEENPYYRNFDEKPRREFDRQQSLEEEAFNAREREGLRRRASFPPSYEQSFQDVNIPRDQVPNNQQLRSNVVNEFLKMFAHQNKLPSEDTIHTNIDSTPYQSSNLPPIARMTRMGDGNGYMPMSPMSPLFQPRSNGNPIERINVPRPTSSMFYPSLAPPYIPSAIQGGSMINIGQQSIPSPQQAAIMTNMGTPVMSYNPFPAQVRNDIANQQGMVMLMVTTPQNKENTDDDNEEKKEIVKHKELTHDGRRRTSSNITEDERDFSLNLKKAANFVLSNAVKDGNISSIQRAEIERKLNRLLDQKYKNKSRGEIRAQTRAKIPRAWNGTCMDERHDCNQFKAGGVCPFMRTFMKGTCTKTCNACPEDNLKGVTAAKLYDYILKKGASITTSTTADFLADIKGIAKSATPKVIISRKIDFKTPKIPPNPVMYLSFENATSDGAVDDNSGNNNKALLEKGAAISPRVLGTCGKAIELNDGSVSWNGDTFKRKPDTAISIAMWVKVKKSGVINWFANGKKGDKTFYAKSKGTAVPAKVWTHVAGTFDSDTGLARIYINGDLEQELQQRKGAKLAKNWLVNGIGSTFGDDSLHYVDEVMVYDRSLSNSEVRMLFNRCMFNRMVLHFGFQKGNKTNINDQSGLDNNGILIGGATQKSNCDRCGACLDLTQGPDPTMRIQQVSVKHLPKIKLSITAWISLNSTSGVHNIFTTESSEGNIGYRLQVVNGRIRWAIGTDTVPVLFDNMTDSVVTPEALWTHIIVTYNNENGLVKIYANGLLKYKGIVPESRREYLPTDWDNDASIGDSTLKGYIDEFIMYNWELDDSEALYVRNYCADHPKLIRFTVRVPLTKKTIVPRVQNRVDDESSSRRNWWDLYAKIAHQKLVREKKETTTVSKKKIDINPSNSFTLLKHKKKR